SLGRQHRKDVAGQDQRRREVGERSREQEQERIGQAGHGQRHRYRAKNMQAPASQAERHLLEIAADAGQHRPQRQVGDREVGQHLGAERACKSIDVATLKTEKIIGDEAAWAKREDERDRSSERRRDERQQGRCIDETNPPRAQAPPRDRESEQKSQRGAEETHQGSQQKAVYKGGAMAGLSEDGEERSETEASIFEEGGRKHHQQGIDDEQPQQQP